MWLDDASRWMLKGKCRGANPEIFDGDPLHDDTAKAFCLRCQVRIECLEYSLKHSTKIVGVWGGLNSDERLAYKRGGRRRSCPGCRGTRVYSDGYNEICVGCGLTWKP